MSKLQFLTDKPGKKDLSLFNNFITTNAQIEVTRENPTDRFGKLSLLKQGNILRKITLDDCLNALYHK